MSASVRFVFGIALTLVLSVSAAAENRCVLETDGVEHTLPHVYVAREGTTIADAKGTHSVDQHWIFCSRHPIEPNPAYGDWLAAARIAILQLPEDDRVEVLVAHDGRVRRASATWESMQAESLHDDPDLPVRFEGTIEDGRARGQVSTETAMKQGPTPWHDAEFLWRVAITLDAPVLGSEP